MPYSHQKGREGEVKQLSQWIQASATNSGHPNVVFAVVSIVTAAFFVLLLRATFG
jgi:hypothetical protein